MRSAYKRALSKCLSSNMVVDDAMCNPSIQLYNSDLKREQIVLVLTPTTNDYKTCWVRTGVMVRY